MVETSTQTFKLLKTSQLLLESITRDKRTVDVTERGQTIETGDGKKIAIYIMKLDPTTPEKFLSGSIRSHADKNWTINKELTEITFY